MSRPAGDGTYKGERVRSQAATCTARHRSPASGPDVMMVKGCALARLDLQEQRWTRVS